MFNINVRHGTCHYYSILNKHWEQREATGNALDPVA